MVAVQNEKHLEKLQEWFNREDMEHRVLYQDDVFTVFFVRYQGIAGKNKIALVRVWDALLPASEEPKEPCISIDVDAEETVENYLQLIRRFEAVM